MLNELVEKAAIHERARNLSNRSSYEYSPEQVEAMFGALQSRIDAVREPFMAKKTETSGFSFGNL